MNSAIELKPEFATVSHAVRFDGDDGIEDQRRALRALISRCGNKGLQGAVKNEKRHIEAMEQEYSVHIRAQFSNILLASSSFSFRLVQIPFSAV